MSYILDALKKSEQERQRGRGPDLQSIHRPADSGAPPSALPWLLIAVLLVALGASAWWLLWPWERARAPHAADFAPVAPAPATTEEPAPASAIAVPEVPAASPPAETATAAPVQELWQLPDPVRRSVPAMTFSFHVYSEDPGQRTIIINNRRMREGEPIGQRWLLEQITREGVVLFSGEHRVHIPVVTGW